jgi:arachidonate 15-lipoxygenase
MVKPYLPQNDPNPQRRQEWLNRNREQYEFDLDYLYPIPYLKQLPIGENFSTRYLAQATSAFSKLNANTLAAKFHSLWDPLNKLQDYEDFFPILPRPSVIKTYQSDNAFAQQRLCGVNPMVLSRIRGEMPAHVQFFLQDVQVKFGKSLELEKLLKEGNLYLADYTSLSFIKGGTYQRGRNYLPTPIAIFCWQSSGYSDRGQLVPIAIAIDPTQNTHFLTPFDQPLSWSFAKLCVQIADANHHEMSSHLGRTHLTIAPFAIASARHLAENHPLSLLLKPHFRFTLAINNAARASLIQEQGPVDELLAGSLNESLTIAKDSFKTWSLDQFAFPKEIANRGMDDVKQLPHYPYRDDGMLVWNALKKFVSSYLRLYYKTPDNLSQDLELQNWTKSLFDLFSLKGMNAVGVTRGKGMPARIETVEQLIDIVTAIIFTCGPQHAAVNFPQYEYMAFTPNMPFALYQPITEDFSVPTKDNLMPFLPPPHQASGQLSTTYLLSSFRYDKLGHYEQEFQDLAAQNLVIQFQQDLNVVELEIEKNNRSRLIEYNYLKPSLIPNSISI